MLPTDPQESPEILVQRRHRCATVTINRPQRHNALATATMARLSSAIDELGADPDIWVVVITGIGERAFCAGGDLKEADELARAGKPYPHPMRGVHRNVFEAVLECRKPTIAAINGAAMGGGLELALACDIRLAVDDAQLALPEAKRGMGANFGSVLLPRLIPRAVALDLLYTGRTILPPEGERLGLINRSFPRSRFQAGVDSYCDELMANAPLTLQRYKQMTTKGWDLPVHAALRLDVGPDPYSSEDRAEGVRAFLEKRPPVWRGR